MFVSFSKVLLFQGTFQYPLPKQPHQPLNNPPSQLTMNLMQAEKREVGRDPSLNLIPLRLEAQEWAQVFPKSITIVGLPEILLKGRV